MRVLVAPDKFKGSLSAVAAAEVMARAVAGVFPDAQADLCPLADGGEGFVEAMSSALAAVSRVERRATRVTGPLPDQRVEAEWAMVTTPTPDKGDRRLALIEMSAAAGLLLVPPGRTDPADRTTFGVGELLLAAHQQGADEILLGIGGSATIDAGLGMCQAAGHTILRRDGEPVAPHDPLCAKDLPDIYLIKRGRGSPLDRIPITVACDVTSPLAGFGGAAHAFGPQKGATPAQCAEFDRLHAAIADRTHTRPQADTPGAGAAGGLGWALLSFFNARLVPGFDVVATAARLHDRIARADLVLTGEGRFDRQSLAGKGPAGLARLARSLGRPVYLFAGRIDADAATEAAGLFTATAPISPSDLSPERAMTGAPGLLHDAAMKLLRTAYTAR